MSAKQNITTNRLKKTKGLVKGDPGVVFWKGVNKFDPSKISVGIELKDGRKVFVNADNVALDFVEFINQGSKT